MPLFYISPSGLVHIMTSRRGSGGIIVEGEGSFTDFLLAPLNTPTRVNHVESQGARFWHLLEAFCDGYLLRLK